MEEKEQEYEVSLSIVLHPIITSTTYTSRTLEKAQEAIVLGHRRPIHSKRGEHKTPLLIVKDCAASGRYACQHHGQIKPHKFHGRQSIEQLP